MIFDHLTLHNFGVYAGRHDLALTPKPGQPIVLFGGLNGCGKTTIADGLLLALYGRRAPCSNRGTLSYDEFLRRSISRRASSADGAAVALTVSVDTESGSTSYRVHRAWRVSGQSVRETLEVYVDGAPDRVLAERWDEHVEELLPLDIAGLFFFDGEKIEALADPGRSRHVVATAVDALLGLSLLERLDNDLTVVQRRKRSVTRDAARQHAVEEAERAYREADQHRQTALQDRAAAQSIFDRSLRTLEEAEARLAAEGGDLHARRDELAADLERLRSERSQVDEHLRELASGDLPLALVGSLLDEIERQADAEQAAVSASAVVDVLDHRDASTLALLREAGLPADALRRVAEFLDVDRDSYRSRAAAAAYLGLSPAVAAQLHHLRTFGLPSAMTALDERLAEADDVDHRLADVDRTIAAIPTLDQVAPLQAAVEAARAELDQAQSRLERSHEEVSLATRLAERAQHRLRVMLEEEASLRLDDEDARRIVEHAERVRATVGALRTRLLDRHLRRIEAAVLESLQRLLRKELLVADVRIDPESFEVTLVTPNDETLTPERMSAGERQLLALALLWGLARVAGRRLPAVIDTPLGRLDSTHRTHLIDRYLPNASHQVLVLSTDKEIDTELAAQLAPSIGRSYVLEHDDSTQTTSIEPGYFWSLTHVA